MTLSALCSLRPSLCSHVLLLSLLFLTLLLLSLLFLTLLLLSLLLLSLLLLSLLFIALLVRSMILSPLSLSRVRVVMMKSKELKTKIYSHAHSLILSTLTLCCFVCLREQCAGIGRARVNSTRGKQALQVLICQHARTKICHQCSQIAGAASRKESDLRSHCLPLIAPQQFDGCSYIPSSPSSSHHHPLHLTLCTFCCSPSAPSDWYCAGCPSP